MFRGEESIHTRTGVGKSKGRRLAAAASLTSLSLSLGAVRAPLLSSQLIPSCSGRPLQDASAHRAHRVTANKLQSVILPGIYFPSRGLLMFLRSGPFCPWNAPRPCSISRCIVGSENYAGSAFSVFGRSQINICMTFPPRVLNAL